MKKIYFTLLAFVLPLMISAQTSIWEGTSSDKSWYQEGNTEYHIKSAAQFRGLAELTNNDVVTFEGKTIYLDCDIDLNNKQWTPIGLHNSKQFAGVFDGNGHIISNLYIDTNNLDYQDMKDNIGLFGFANQAEIRNLKVEGALYIGGNGKYIGGIASFVKRLENINTNIIIELQSNKSSSYIGTVVANVTEAENIYCTGEIRCSANYIGLWSQCYVGGVAGICTNISKCVSDVKVNVNRVAVENTVRIGGISGQSVSISNAIFTGIVSVNYYNCNTDQFIPMVAGISGTLSKGDHIVSVPQMMSYGRGFVWGTSIITPNISNATISDTYYLNKWATANETYGVSMTESELKSGNPLPNFDTKIWDFKLGEYPSLRTNGNEVSDVAINEENFPDKIFRNYLLFESFGSDSIITKDEIAEITSISVNSKNISSLKGIEFFTSLKKLSCQYCKLETLDVSACTELESLYCDNNKLTSLNVSGCSKISTFQCFNNSLSSLDISGLTKLTYLPCYKNQLTTINVSGCTQLTSIRCHKNKIYGDGMDAFINSLPYHEGSTLWFRSDTESEENFCSRQQVLLVKEKGWSIMSGTEPYDGTGDELKDDVKDEYGRIAGVYYELNKSDNTAKVVSGPQMYEGDIVVKDYIVSEKSKYTVTAISRSAFLGNKNVTSVKLPDCVTSIEDLTFMDCTNLVSVNIPEQVTTLLQGTFRNCTSLKSIKIPKNITSFEYDNVFNGCSGLVSIVVDEENKVFDSRNNCNAIIETATNKLVRGCNRTIIPSSVNYIGTNAFYGCSTLNTIEIPGSIISIGSDAFSNCTALSTIVIPNSVIEIWSGAFFGCTGLTSVTLPNSLTKLEGSAFEGCSGLTSFTFPDKLRNIQASTLSHCTKLETVTFSASILKIGGGVLRDCPSIKTIYCYSNVPPTTPTVLGDGLFGTYNDDAIAEKITLHVPALYVNSYKTTRPWNSFGRIVPIGAEKCKNPTISYTNGQLKFDCETEGVTFMSSITDNDIKDHAESIINLSATYNISVFAIKDGYEDSEVATATLCWIDAEPWAEGTKEAEDNVTEVKAMPVLIQAEGNIISVQGAAEGTDISVYNTAGIKLNSAIAKNGITTLNTTLPSGSTAIVKIGEKSVKVLMK